MLPDISPLDAGPITDDVELPTRNIHAKKYPLRDLLDELQPGQSRTIAAPAGLTILQWQSRCANTAKRIWGKGGHATRVEGKSVRIWRLTERQRAELLAMIRERESR